MNNLDSTHYYCKECGSENLEIMYIIEELKDFNKELSVKKSRITKVGI